MDAQTQEKFDPVELTNKLINSWLDQTAGLPVTLQLTKLGFAVIAALEEAYKAGQAAATSNEPDKAAPKG